MVEIIVTEKCNWKCFYCFYNKFKNSIKLQWNENNLLKIKILNKSSTILLTGGEVGFINEDDLKKLFKFFSNSKFIINTNGLFFEKFGFKYDKFIKEYYFHIIPDKNYSINPNIKKFNNEKVKIGIVETPTNLLKIIKENQDVFFDYIGVETLEDNFQYYNYKDIFLSLLSFKNVNQYWVNKLISLSQKTINFSELQKKCYLNPQYIVYNMIRDEFVKCSHLFWIKKDEKNYNNECKKCYRKVIYK